MLTYRFGLGIAKRTFAFLIVVGITAEFVSAAGSDQRDEVAPKKKSAEKSEGLQVQQTDEPAKPIEPLKQRTPEEQKKVDAAAHFMTGKLKEAKGDIRGAYAEYEKAVELNPDEGSLYRVLVPLAFDLKKNKEALEYAQKAISLNPNDYEMLHRLGRHMAERRNLGEAIKFLEQAAASKSLKKQSRVYVMVKRDLAILYSASDQKTKAADAYEIVFNALQNPEKFDLDFQTRAQLLGSSSGTYELIGQAFLDADRLELAVKAFETAAKARGGGPGNPGYNLARVYLKTKNYDKALEQLQKYFDSQLQSKGREAYDLLAEILKASNQADQLIGKLEAIAAKDNRNSTLQFYLADQYVAADRLADAEALYKKTLDFSKDVDGYIGLSAIYRKTGRANDLLEALGRALGAARNSQQLASTLSRLDAELKAIVADRPLVDKLLVLGSKLAEGEKPKLDFSTAVVLASLAAEAKKTDEMVRFYRFGLALRPDLAGLILDELGAHLLRADRYEDAIKTYQEAIADPALADAKPDHLFRLSQAYEFAGNTKAALEAVHTARGIVPDHPLLHFQEGWIYYHSHQWDEAARIFEEVKSKYPQHQEIVRRCKFTLSNLYVQKGDIKKGEAILEEVLVDTPDDPSVNNDLGYLYADQGKNLEQAEKMIRKAVAAEPDNNAYLDSLGWVLFKLGKYDEALANLKKAIKDDPSDTDATIWEHLGDCQEKLKQQKEAVESWTKALEAAKKDSRPDEKLVERLNQKLGHKADAAVTAPRPK